ncbi:MAG: PadR family transcriptional regulator [Acidobacteria bacterium]|nr:PadR family transcriptional regulator [Acidobacteriota bacterium]
MSKEQPAATPLRPIEFYVLLGLVQGELHGYAIIQRTAEQSNGRVRLDPGTLYRAIARLRQAGLLEEAERKPAEDAAGRPRRYYALTREGRNVAEIEARRLADLTRDAVAAGLLDKAELG